MEDIPQLPIVTVVSTDVIDHHIHAIWAHTQDGMWDIPGRKGYLSSIHYSVNLTRTRRFDFQHFSGVPDRRGCGEPGFFINGNRPVGLQLVALEMPLPEGAAEMSGIIIPRKAVTEVRKLIDEAADVINISLSESKIRFSFDHIVLTSKLIDGTFPDYEKVIPANNDKVVEVDPKLFSSAIDRVSTISDGKSRAVKVIMNGKVMTLSANSPDAGSATEDVEINSDVADLEIGFNAKYLMDITSQIEGEGCTLTLADAASPTIIREAGDSSALYVLMPLRV